VLLLGSIHISKGSAFQGEGNAWECMMLSSQGVYNSDKSSPGLEEERALWPTRGQ